MDGEALEQLGVGRSVRGDDPGTVPDSPAAGHRGSWSPTAHHVNSPLRTLRCRIGVVPRTLRAKGTTCRSTTTLSPSSALASVLAPGGTLALVREKRVGDGRRFDAARCGADA